MPKNANSEITIQVSSTEFISFGFLAPIWKNKENRVLFAFLHGLYASTYLFIFCL